MSEEGPGSAPPVSDFSYVGGNLALDFANTLGDRGSDHPLERLREFGDLVWWSYGADLIGGRTARGLLAAARKHPGQAAAVLDRARELREALHRSFTATAGGGVPRQPDLDVLNRELGRALPRLEVRPGGGCCTLEFASGDEALDRLLWSVARAAVDLLTSPRVERVKQCHSSSCDWLFLDESRNRSRRWCDMRECGNRAKARRHYARGKRRRSQAGVPADG